MIIIIGLVLLIAAVVVGVAGVLTNTGAGHALGVFSTFGYHVTGSTGALFLYGLVVGAVAMLGLGLLLTGARRTSRRASEARHGMRQARRETAAVADDRDDLIDQRDRARAQAAAAQSDTAAAPGTPVSANGDTPASNGGAPAPADASAAVPATERTRIGPAHLFGHKTASR